MASRISSAPSRLTACFQSNRLSGSTRSAAISSPGLRLADWRYAAEVTISRCSGLRLPALPHQLLCQPVEKLGVAGKVAQPPEVTGCADKPSAEMVLPDPIDDHSRRKRVISPAQPAGQCQPATGRPRARLDPRTGFFEYRREARLDRLPGRVHPESSLAVKPAQHR